ncbi:MAG TPA: GyrI-like domain-containing protein [Roseiflexaceae bacterium]|nr:GyrI-like domain-containing protein [Roseiflexaceae bacterium]
MAAVDLKKAQKWLYTPSAKEVAIVDVLPMQFLMVDGSGDPNSSSDYAAVVEALFTYAYALKFRVRAEQGIDYGVLPLEGLWWTADMAQFSADRKGEWKWTMLIAQPEYVDAALVGRVREQVMKKVGAGMVARVRFDVYDEGRAAQIMYIGPYAAEAAAIARVHAFIAANGYVLHGKHHEIYLKDMRRTAPEKLATIIRQPCRLPNR